MRSSSAKKSSSCLESTFIKAYALGVLSMMAVNSIVTYEKPLRGIESFVAHNENQNAGFKAKAKTKDGTKRLASSQRTQDRSSGEHESDVVVDDGPQSNNTELKTDGTSSASSPYAYFWIIGAIHEDRPAYKGFILDVLVSASLLRKTGSTADFWLYVRLSPDSKLERMPEKDLRFLHALGVKVKHLEKPKHESFSQLMYDKFYILNMTEYKRVMFLDADTVPLTNLDYYFHLSDPDYKALPTLLKPFFLFATRGEPTNGGMFIVEPSKRIYEQYKETVRLQHESGKKLPYPHFDIVKGWGYSFIANRDVWEAMNRKGRRWVWYGAHVDQGLMYYISKFLVKECSIAIGKRIQNWKGVQGRAKPEKESEVEGMLEKYQPKLLAYQWNCDQGGYGDWKWTCNPPYDSFAHFTGSTKPWQNEFDKEVINAPVKSVARKGASALWFKELFILNEQHDMGIDFDNWNEKYLKLMKESALGYIPLYKDQAEVMEHVSKGDAFNAQN